MLSAPSFSSARVRYALYLYRGLILATAAVLLLALFLFLSTQEWAFFFVADEQGQARTFSKRGKDPVVVIFLVVLLIPLVLLALLAGEFLWIQACRLFLSRREMLEIYAMPEGPHTRLLVNYLWPEDDADTRS